MKLITLNNKKDFDCVFSNKQSFGNRHFTLLYCKNDLSYNRIGIIVSKKFSKKAVVRNRMRRQIKAMFRMNLESILDGYDFVIIPKRRCLNDDYSDFSPSFLHLFFKQGLLKAKQNL